MQPRPRYLDFVARERDTPRAYNTMTAPRTGHRWTLRIGKLRLHFGWQWLRRRARPSKRGSVEYFDLDGKRTKVNPSQCIGIERFSVWEHDHVEQRLRDYYNGVVNKNEDVLRVNGLLM